MKHPWKEADKLSRSGTPFVMVTWIATKGHAPQEVGTKALVTADGLYAGTVGGGNVEATAITEAKKILANPENFKPKIMTWNLQRDVDMTCGGEVTVLFELMNSKPWRVIIFGAGHVGQAMASILSTLYCRATFVDSRSDWLLRLPNSENIERVCLPEIGDHLDTLLQEKELDPYLLIMTKGHSLDVSILKQALKKFPNAPYIGVIGSKVKAIKIRSDLKQEGFSLDAISKLHCPMGLTLGTNDPAEIAISISAEVIQVLNAKEQT
jgi:xanthine dehydrogenase accessory factor